MERAVRTAETVFSRKNLEIDAPAEVERICRWIQDTIALKMKRQGAVVALSGGIDSSTVAALCVRALGRVRSSVCRCRNSIPRKIPSN